MTDECPGANKLKSISQKNFLSPEKKTKISNLSTEKEPTSGFFETIILKLSF